MAIKGMAPKNLNDLEGWDLIWAMAKYVSGKDIKSVGSLGFGYLSGEMLSVPDEDGGPDKKKPEMRLYTLEDHRKLLSSFDPPFEEEGVTFIYRVEGVGEFRGIHQSEVKARAVIAMHTNSNSVDF